MEYTNMNTNLLIVWNESDNLGIPIIDEQHRCVVSTINSLYCFLRTKSAKKMLNPVINSIREYTKIHFYTEERILADTGYPHLLAHQELHAKLTAKALSVGNESILMGDPQAFLLFLKEWWLNHIRQQDRLYVAYVIGQLRLGDSGNNE